MAEPFTPITRWMYEEGQRRLADQRRLGGAWLKIWWEPVTPDEQVHDWIDTYWKAEYVGGIDFCHWRCLNPILPDDAVTEVLPDGE